MNPWKAASFATSALIALILLAPGNEAGQVGQFFMALGSAANLFIGLATKIGEK